MISNNFPPLPPLHCPTFSLFLIDALLSPYGPIINFYSIKLLLLILLIVICRIEYGEYVGANVGRRGPRVGHGGSCFDDHRP